MKRKYWMNYNLFTDDLSCYPLTHYLLFSLKLVLLFQVFFEECGVGSGNPIDQCISYMNLGKLPVYTF